MMRKRPRLMPYLLVPVLVAPIAVSAGVKSVDELPVGMMPALAESLAKQQIDIYGPVAGEKATYQVDNPRHGIKAEFNQSGVQLKVKDAEIGMRLTGFGREHSLNKVEPVNPVIDGVKVNYQHKQLDHWFINSSLGLEQGFTVEEKIEGEGQLQVRLSLSSHYKTVLKNNQLIFQNEQGDSELNYGQLVAFDKEGNKLPSSMSLASNVLILTVDDSNAKFPIIIDPLFGKEVQLLGTSSNMSVAIDGDVVVIGHSAGGTDGLAYIHYRHQGGLNSWGLVKTLTRTTDINGSNFGSSIAIDGDTLVVGDMGDGLNGSGALYIFQQNQGGADNWGLIKKNIISSDSQDASRLGANVAISGDTIVAGALDHTAANWAGAVYMFQRNQSGADNWGLLQKIVAGDASANAYFGSDVDIDGSTLVVGQEGTEGAFFTVGHVYLFSQNQGGTNNWGQTNKITASDISDYDYFGRSLAISGDTLVVGSPGDDGSFADQGAIYLFGRNQGGTNNWGQIKKINNEPNSTNIMGQYVDIFNDYVVTRQRLNATGLYQKDQGGVNNWGQVKTLASDGPLSLGALDMLVGGDLLQTATDLAVILQDDTDPVLPANNFNYTATVTNIDSEVDAVNTLVDINLPTGVTYVSDNFGCTEVTGVVSCTINNLAVTGVQSISVLVNAATTGVQNASVSTSSDIVDIDTANNTDTEATIVNTSPTIIGSAISTIVHDSAYSFIPTSGDADGDTLTFSIVNQPSWANFNNTTGELSGTPLISDTGSYSGIVISVSDTLSTVAFPTFAIEVTNAEPTIIGTPLVTIVHDSAYSFIPTSNDADGDTLTFSIQNQPSWANFDTATGELSGTPIITDTASYTGIIISVTDGLSTVDLAAFNIEVTNADPTLSGSPAGQAEVGSTYIFIPASGDANNDTLSFSGTNVPSWLNLNASTGALTGTPSLSNLGTYNNITITVSDGFASVNLPAFSITVVEQIVAVSISGSPSLAVNEGTSYSFVPTVAGGVSSATLTFSISNPPIWASFDTATGQLSGTPTVVQVGSYTNISITVTDGDTSDTLGPFNVDVVNVPLAISGSPITSVANGNSYSFTPTVAGASGVLTFSIQNAPAWASFNSSTGQLSGTTSGTDVGVYTGIQISVTDGFETVILSGFSIIVTSTPPTIAGVPGTSVSSSSTYSFTPSASDADGDTLSFSIQNQPSWASFNTTTGELSGTPVSINVGTDSNIIISVTDGESIVDLPAFDIAIINDAPVANDDLVIFDVGTSIGISNGVSIDVLSNDSDANGDTLIVSLLSSTTNQGGSVSVETSGNIAYQPASGFVGNDNFSYTITDENGATDTAAVTITVTNDSSSGGNGGGGSLSWSMMFIFTLLMFHRARARSRFL